MNATIAEMRLAEAVCKKGGHMTPFISLHLVNVSGADLQDIDDGSARVDFQYVPHEEDASYSVLQVICTSGFHREGDYVVPDSIALEFEGLMPARDASWFEERVINVGRWWFLVRFDYAREVLYFTVAADGTLLAHEFIDVNDVQFAYPHSFDMIASPSNPHPELLS